MEAGRDINYQAGDNSRMKVDNRTVDKKGSKWLSLFLKITAIVIGGFILAWLVKKFGLK